MILERNVAATEAALGRSSGQISCVSLKRLSETPEPPTPKDTQLYLVAAGASMAYSIFCPWADARELKLASLAACFVALYLVFEALHWNRTVYQREFERWECTWKCLGCGFVFVPPAKLRPLAPETLAAIVSLDALCAERGGNGVREHNRTGREIGPKEKRTPPPEDARDLAEARRPGGS